MLKQIKRLLREHEEYKQRQLYLQRKAAYVRIRKSNNHHFANQEEVNRYIK